MKRNNLSYLSIWLPLLIGLMLLPVPLLGNFHIESALLAALIGCFWAGWRGCKAVKNKRGGGLRIGFILRCLYLPGGVLLVYAVIAGCFSWNGLGFWLLYPLPSVMFGYTVGRLLRKWKIPYRRIIAMVVLVFVAVGVFAWEFFHFPQVYFFNQVWGGWPGPIYDESITISWSLILFRAITGLWIALLWWMPVFQKSVRAKLIIIISAVLLVTAYTHLPDMGIITPRWYVQKKLGGKKETAHFIIYYDQSQYRPDDINYYARREEFYYQQITKALQLQQKHQPKIESYFYGQPWQKKALVGAKFTSYVPVWLAQDQLHIAKQELPGSLKHELVHVLAKRFGNKLFNGSWSIGLMEGAAVALAGNISPVSTINQIVAAQKPYPSAYEMRQAFSFWGFYGGRSAVNYVQSGSFVRYLLHHFPSGDFKRAYRRGNIAAGYPVPLDSLVAGWHGMLKRVTVDSVDRQRSARLYGIPSLLEEKCPHVQSKFSALWDRAHHAIAVEDTARALTYFAKARKQAPDEPYVKNTWAYLNLLTGRYEKVQQQASVRDSTVDGLLLDADAFALTAKMKRAQFFVAKAAKRLESHPDSVELEALKVRNNAFQWKNYRQIIYKNRMPSDSIFRMLDAHTQAGAIQQAFKGKHWGRISRYAQIMAPIKLNKHYTQDYLRLLRLYALNGKKSIINCWLRKLSRLSLRSKYKNDLHNLQKWVEFLAK